MLPEYTIAAVIAVLATLGLERWHWRSGIFRQRAYWIGMVIVAFFMVLVDGWLTKLGDPVVLYDERFITGLRVPFDIPVEDYLFGFALTTAAQCVWVRSRPGSTTR